MPHNNARFGGAAIYRENWSCKRAEFGGSPASCCEEFQSCSITVNTPDQTREGQNIYSVTHTHLVLWQQLSHQQQMKETEMSWTLTEGHFLKPVRVRCPRVVAVRCPSCSSEEIHNMAIKAPCFPFFYPQVVLFCVQTAARLPSILFSRSVLPPVALSPSCLLFRWRFQRAAETSWCFHPVHKNIKKLTVRRKDFQQSPCNFFYQPPGSSRR